MRKTAKLTTKQIAFLVTFAGLDILIVCGLLLTMTSDRLSAYPPTSPTFYVTPIPTRPQVPPTWTPTPYAATRATSNTDGELVSYITEVLPITERLNEWCGKWGMMLSMLSQSPELMIHNDSWNIATAAAMVGVKEAAKDILEMQPPASVNECHSHLRRAATHYDQAVDVMSVAIDEIDSQKMQQANSLIQTASDAFDAFYTCIEKRVPQ